MEVGELIHATTYASVTVIDPGAGLGDGVQVVLTIKGVDPTFQTAAYTCTATAKGPTQIAGSDRRTKSNIETAPGNLGGPLAVQRMFR